MADSLRLGVLATHPIQYHAPLFRELTGRPGVELTVYFAHQPTPVEQGAGFGVPFTWDVDLTSGYRHVFLGGGGGGEAAGPGAPATRDAEPDMEEAIRHRDFDSFLVMGWHDVSYRRAIRACWSARVPVLVRGDSQLTTDASAVKRAVKRVTYPYFMRRFAACLSVGRRSEEYFRHYGARRVIRSPHFVDNAFFAARAAAFAPRRAELRQSWGATDDSVVVLFAGKLQTKKRPLDLVSAVARSARPNLRVLVVGDGELRQATERAAAEEGVPATFTGFLNQTEIPAAYAAADVLALPSDAGETWGLVVNEAMASGLPAIVSDAAGCAPDLIVPDVTGWRHPLGDVDAVASILRRIADAPQLLRGAGNAARMHVAGYNVCSAADGVLAAADAGLAEAA
ncbi:MAG TPA: glycosyltransferase family 4 protein [Gemmatimonadaceae bacterium]|nr:glycosyltransferase family 4 protein [Gemmatimonadaceae bacterium]